VPAEPSFFVPPLDHQDHKKKLLAKEAKSEKRVSILTPEQPRPGLDSFRKRILALSWHKVLDVPPKNRFAAITRSDSYSSTYWDRQTERQAQKLVSRWNGDYTVFEREIVNLGLTVQLDPPTVAPLLTTPSSSAGAANSPSPRPQANSFQSPLPSLPSNMGKSTSGRAAAAGNFLPPPPSLEEVTAEYPGKCPSHQQQATMFGD